jgi:hypothetical protein
VDGFVEPTPVGGYCPPHPSGVQTASIHQPDALWKNQVGPCYLSCLPLQDRYSFREAIHPLLESGEFSGMIFVKNRDI